MLSLPNKASYWQSFKEGFQVVVIITNNTKICNSKDSERCSPGNSLSSVYNETISIIQEFFVTNKISR